MIAPTAHIDPTARIDATAQIGPGVVVGPHSEIGPGNQLLAYAVVGAYTVLGARCVVHSFAVIGGPAQDRQTDPDAPHRLVCGARNVFREGSTVSRGSEHGGGETRLGDDNLLMAHSHIGHDARIGSGIVLANGVSLAGHVSVGDRANFGGHAAVHQFARVGELAFVAGNAMVARDVPPFCIAAGDRARLFGLNVTGLRRAGCDAAERAALKRAYKTMFHGVERRAAAAMLADDPRPRIARLARFVLDSQRGIARHASALTVMRTAD